MAAVNDDPVAVGETFAMTEDDDYLEGGFGEGSEANLLDNDSDVDGDILTISGLEGGFSEGDGGEYGEIFGAETDYGYVMAASTGEWVYFGEGNSFDYLAQGESAFDSFTYYVSDGQGGFDEATATIEITGVNDAPEVDGIVSFEMDENGAIQITEAQLLEMASDVDNPEDLEVLNLVVNGGDGTLTDNGDGTWSFEPTADFFGEINLSYDVSDGIDSTSASATITVNEVAAPQPTATDDTIITNIVDGSDITIQSDWLVANDEPIEGGSAEDLLVASVSTEETLGFESGDFSDWQTTGSAQIVSGYGSYVPTEGDYMVQLTASNESEGSLESFLGVDLPSAVSYGAAITTTLSLSAGDTISFDWMYDAADYMPYDDPAYFTTDSGEVVRLSGVATVGSYGESGWQTYTYTASESGELTLGLAVTNFYDGINDPRLLVDNLVISGGTAGLVVLDAEGVISLTPADTFPDDDATFSYTITDGEGVSDKAGVTIEGEDTDDLWGTADDDIMVGRGDNQLYGEGGDDILSAGTGMDPLWSDVGTEIDSWIEEFPGAEGSPGGISLFTAIETWDLQGLHAFNKLDGGDGDDVLIGGAGDNELLGGEGKDQLIGGTIFNDVSGTWTETWVQDYVDEGGSSIYTNAETGTFSGLYAFNELSGGAGEDELIGGVGFNYGDGGQGDDVLSGSTALNTFAVTWTGDWGSGGASGSYAYSELLGGEGGGSDELHGGVGDNWLEGGEGNDELFGGSGYNTISITDTYQEGETNVSVSGEFTYAFNYLDGGLGADELTGGDGFNYLVGGDGADIITAGDSNAWSFFSEGGTTVEDFMHYALPDDYDDNGDGADDEDDMDPLDAIVHAIGDGIGTFGEDFFGEGGQVFDNVLEGGSGADTFIVGGGSENLITDFEFEDVLVFEGFSAADVNVSTEGDLVIGAGTGEDRTEVTLNNTSGLGYSVSDEVDENGNATGNAVVTLIGE